MVKKINIKKIISKLIIGEIIHKLQSHKSFEKTLKDLQKEIEKNGFSIKSIHNLKQTFKDKNIKLNNNFEYQIIQFCNAEKAFKALSMSEDVGIMMPKNIIIYQNSKGVFIQFMKMKPLMIKLIFPEINLTPISKKVMKTMEKITKNAIK